MANTQELMLRIRGDNTDAERKLSQTGKSVEGFELSTRKASSAMKVFGRDLLNVRDTSDLVSAATRALGSVIAGSLGGTAVIVAGKALIDAYRSVQDSAKEAEKSISAVRKSAEKIGAGEGMQTTAGAAKALASEAEKVSEKLKEIESNKLKNFIAGITRARERMAELVAETEKQAKALERQGVVNTLIDMERSKNLSDTDKAIRAIGEKYQPIIEAARATRDVELLNSTILQAQAEQMEVLKKAREADGKEAKRIASARAKADADNATQNEIDETRRIRNLERERAEIERQVKINEERLRQEQTMANVAETRLRVEKSRAVYSGKGGRTRSEFGQANEEDVSSDQRLLESTRAGRNDLEVARKRRARLVQQENFREGNKLGPKERRGMAEQIAAAEMPTIREQAGNKHQLAMMSLKGLEQAGGKDQLAMAIEKLVSIIGAAPLVTSGAGSN